MQQLGRQADYLLKLQAVTDTLLAHLELDELLNELLIRVREIMETDTAAILLLDASRGELVARAAKGLEEEVERGVRIPLGRGFAGRVAAERRTIFLPDVDHADVLNPLLREKGIKSLLGTPLLVQDRVLGVLHTGTLRPHKFTREEEALLELVAARAGIGIERAIAHEELVRLDELKSNFIAVASHELRTPVTVLYGVSESLRRRGDELTEETKADLLVAFHEQSTRLKLLVDQLLDLSRVDTHAVEIVPTDIVVREAVEEVIRTVAPDAADRVELHVEPELTFVVDRNAFERVISNLIGNARRYGAPPIVVTAEAQDRHYRLAIEDRGRGVEPDFVPRLFDRFSRSESSREGGTSGAGLGLSIARAYANAHGGELYYTPAAPHGARFELVIPRAPRSSS